MRPLTGELLLDAWERAAGEDDLWRPLTLLALAGRTREDAADLSVAERDLELLRLRRMTFGDALRGCHPCGACLTRVEFEIAVSSMIERLEGLRPMGVAGWRTERFTFSMRPATSRDLAAIAGSADPRRDLLARCTSVEPEGGDGPLSRCESVAIDRFNELNAGAETRFAVPCPACGAIGHADLDIGRFLWTEIRHAAAALLRDVHDLASAYGWSEASILSMNGARRAKYLEMART